MTTQNPAASAQDMGSYLFQIDHENFFNHEPITGHSVELADAFLNTVDTEEYLDGFVDVNSTNMPACTLDYQDGDGYTGSAGYVGLESRQETLKFFDNNKALIMEAVDALIDELNNGDKHAFFKGLYGKPIDDLELIAAYKGLISDSQDLTENQSRMRELLALGLVNEVAYWMLSSYDTLKELKDRLLELN